MKGGTRMEELTPAETGLLLAKMREDGQVQSAIPLRAESVAVPRAKLSARQINRARFYSALIDGEPAGRAIRNVLPGVPGKRADSTASAWVNRPTFQRIVQQAMGAAGVTPERIARKIAQQMDAETVKFFPDGRGTIEERRVPDNEAQIKAARLAHDILLATTEYAPAPPSEAEHLAEGLKELTLDELQRRAVELNAGSADARTRGSAATKRG